MPKPVKIIVDKPDKKLPGINGIQAVALAIITIIFSLIAGLLLRINK